jgi:hypothetical protein
MIFECRSGDPMLATRWRIRHTKRLLGPGSRARQERWGVNLAELFAVPRPPVRPHLHLPFVGERAASSQRLSQAGHLRCREYCSATAGPRECQWKHNNVR